MVWNMGERMTWGNTMTKAKTAPMRFQDVSTKPDDGEREAPLQQDEPRRNQTKVTTKAKMKPKEKAEGERRRQRPRQEEEEDEYQRSPMPACHRQIRSDGKADEGAKY